MRSVFEYKSCHGTYGFLGSEFFMCWKSPENVECLNQVDIHCDWGICLCNFDFGTMLETLEPLL